MSIWGSLAPHDIGGIKDWDDPRGELAVTIDVATNGGMDQENPIRFSMWHTDLSDDLGTFIMTPDAARAVAQKLVEAADGADRTTRNV